MCSLLLGVASSFAYEVGDYAYTRTARYKINGENLLSNGDFSDGLTDWTNTSNQTLSTDTFLVQTITDGDDDLNGKNSIIVLVESAVTDVSTALYSSVTVFRSVPVTSGTYLVSYKMKPSSNSNTTINNTNGRSDNNQTIYYSTTDTPEALGSSDANQVAEVVTYTTDDGWITLNYTVSVTESGYINILFFNLNQNDAFADFGVYEVYEVCDLREVQDLYDEYSYYLDSIPDFTESRDNMEGIVMPVLKAMVDEDEETLTGFGISLDDVDALDNVSVLMNEYVTEFLNANTVDLTSYYTNFTFDASSYSGWTNTGGRWQTSSAHDNFTTPHVRNYINNYYGLTTADMYQSANLPGGKLLYVIQAQAFRYYTDGSGSSSNSTIPDYYTQVDGFYMYINDNIFEMADVPAKRGKKYFAYTEVEEGAQTIGFYSPGSTSNGGSHYFDNLQIRLVGQTEQDVIDHYFLAAQESLQVAIDSATTVINNDYYIFGKDVLQDSIDSSNAIMELTTPATEEMTATVNAQTSYMLAAISAYYTVNLEYTTLYEDIQTAQATLDELQNAGLTEGVDAFSSAISTAQGVYDAADASNRDSTALVEADEALLYAQLVFTSANACYDYPADIPVTNNSFQLSNSTGWTQDGKTGNDRWQFSNSTGRGEGYEYSEGYYITYNRGTAATDEKYIYQDVEIVSPGLYVFKAEGQANDPRVTSVTSTTDTETYLYINNDSVMMVTPGSGTSQIRNTIDSFECRVVITEEYLASSNTVRIGLYKAASNAATIVELSSCHLWFYGDYDAYVADSIAKVLEPTLDSLQAAIDAAQALYDAARNKDAVDTTPFTNAISTAQSVHDNADSSFDEILAQFTALEEATQDFKVSGVWPAEGEYYDLTFTIDDPEFTDTELTVWNPTGLVTSFTFAGDGYMYYYNATGSALESSSISQTVSGLPSGEYQFLMNATYRYSLSNEYVWDTSLYTNNVYMYIFAGDNVTYVNGLLAEGQGLAEDTSDPWIYWNDLVMSNYDYRHLPNVDELFDGGFFQSAVEFSVGSDGEATIGLTMENLPNASYMFFRDPVIRYWGDTVADGISEVNTDSDSESNINAPGNIYTISGVMVRSNATSFDGLEKGVYIKNGKKIVVK